MSPSFWQILIVVVIALLIFGPSRIPGLGKSLGQAIRGFKKGISEDAEIDVTDSAQREQLKDKDTNSNTHTTSTQKKSNKTKI